MALIHKRIFARGAALVLSAAALTLSACKEDDPATSSQTKDFTYSDATTTKNFAIVGGFNPENPDGVNTDILNWKNMLTRGQLGVFQVVYASNSASAAEITAAFKQVGGQLDANSTVLFAYSGRSAGGKLRAKDGMFSFGDAAGQMVEAAKAAGKTGGHRLYIFNDSSPVDANLRSGAKIDKNRYALSTQFAALKATPPFFSEFLEFGASSNDLTRQNNAVSYAGRFTYEFTKLLDTYVSANGKIGSTPDAVPTLDTFFKQVAQTTTVSAFGPATYIASPTTLLNEKMFSAGIIQTAQAAQAASKNRVPTPTPALPVNPNGGDSTAVASVFDLALTGPNGPTNLKSIFKGKAMLIEISVDWCGPCANLAQEINTDSGLKTMEAEGGCSHATILPNDGNNLATWNSATGNTANEHSFAYDGSTDQIVSNFVSKLTGSSISSISSYPTEFAVRATGEIFASNQDGVSDPLSALKSECNAR